MRTDRNSFMRNVLNHNQDIILKNNQINNGASQNDFMRDIKDKQDIIDSVKKSVIDFFGDKLIIEKDNPQFHMKVKNFIKTALEKNEDIGSNIQIIAKLTSDIFDDIIGVGPIQPLLSDDNITEIMVSRWDKIFVERGGKMVLEPSISFNSEEHLQTTIQKIVQPMGNKIDDSDPEVDTSLPDGSRVNATIPPASPKGATLTIRKFSKKKLTPEDYLNFGSLDERMVEFLKFAIIGKVNTIVGGGTGTGKTTLLNMISQFVPDDEAIVTIEDTLELQLQKNNVRALLARKAVNGKGELTIRQHVKNSLRMRPDRIIVGEIRDSTIIDMLDSMSSGHEGGLGTIHTKSPRHLVDIRIPVLMGMGNVEMEPSAQKKMIADSIDLIVYIKRFRDGSRKITNITEVVGYGTDGAGRLKLKNVDENKIYLKDIFTFKEEGYVNGKLQGRYLANNYIPKRIIEKAAIYGSYIDENIFFEQKEEGINDGLHK